MAAKPSMSEYALTNKYDGINPSNGGGKSEYDNLPDNIDLPDPDFEQTKINRDLPGSEMERT